MSERTSYPPGTFSWADLSTSDADAAKAFYAALFGWEFDDMPAGPGLVYSMARKDGHDVAALSAGDEPPHWNNYVTVISADEAATKAEQLGANIMAPPFDVLGAGRMAVVQDPTGAILAAWEPRDHHGARLVNAPGAMTWNDLTTPDVDKAAEFYGEWLGWRTEEIPEADGYRVIFNGERSNGGMRQATDMPAFWCPYFGTEDVERGMERVRELGGQVHFGPQAVPQGAFAVVGDPQGAVFAIWSGRYDD
ncbi:MAG TPA: VOC family protein [Solirubrobacteraceae bacterium]|nr:VOC family protein [Solirubrobacteraceae bacterium]